jgi:glutaredoxin 3
MAKRLLDRRGVAYEEVNLDDRPELTDDVVERSGGRMTVPQIFIGGRCIGGYQELVALDRSGGLDALLTAGD